MYFNLLFNNLNIRFIQIWSNFEICIWGLTGIVICCSRPHLNLFWCVVPICIILPWVASCGLVMHHAWLCIMSCYVLCVYLVIFFFPVVLLLDSSCFIAITRIYSSRLGSPLPVRLLHGLVLLPSRILGKMTVTLDLTIIIAMLVVLMLSLCRASYHLFFEPPKLPWQPLTFFTLPSKPLFGYVTALLRPSYSIASCRCSCRLFLVGTWIS